MLEKNIAFTLSNEKVIEKLLDEDALAINHMVLPPDAGLPEHVTNAPVYMIVARGQIDLQLNGQESHTYQAGRIILIPYKVRMQAHNTSTFITELFVIKAPGPRSMAGK